MRDMARRGFLTKASLSAFGLVAIAGIAAPASAQKRGAGNAAKQDAALLNAAIALEHEAVGVYQIAAESGLLTPEAVGFGVKFQGHHKQHRDVLATAITRLGGKPAEAKSMAEYGKVVTAAGPKNQEDVLRLALKLERGAANAYAGLLAPLASTDLDTLVARIMADEVVHVATFMSDLEIQISEKAFQFG